MAKKRSRNKQRTSPPRESSPPAPSPPAANKSTKTAPASLKDEGFEQLDDFFFGSATGQFQRDDFDYDPFDDHSVVSDSFDSVSTRGDIKATVVAEVPDEVKDKLAAQEATKAKARLEKGPRAKKVAKAAAAKAAAAEQKAKKEAEAKAKKEAAAKARADEKAARAKAQADEKAARAKTRADEKAARAKTRADEKAAAERAQADARAKQAADEKAAKKKAADEKAAKKQAADEAKAKKQADEKAAREQADADKARSRTAESARQESDKRAALDRQTASELEAMGVPLGQRRAAGTAAAAAAEDGDLVVAGGTEEGDGNGRTTNPGKSLAELGSRSGLGVVPASASDLGGGWDVAARELVAEAESLSSKKDADRRAVLQYEVGRIHAYRLGDWDSARTYFEAAVSSKEDFVPAMRELVRLAVSRKDWDGAVGLLATQATATSSSVGKTAAMLASAHIQLTEQSGKQESAAKVLMEALEVHPENYIALRFLRVIHYDREEYGPLVGVLEQARKLAGDAEKLRIDYEIGRVQDEVLQDSQSALVAFQRALADDGRLIPAFLYAEQLLTAGGDKAGLVKLWRNASEAWGDPDISWWRARAARLADVAGVEADEVAGDWKRAVETAAVPEFIDEEYRHWLASQGRHDELAAASEAALEKVSDHRVRASLCATLGRIALSKGAPGDATLWFEQALDADPTCVDAREGRRQVAVAAGDWDDLLAQLEQSGEAATSTRVKLALCLKKAEVALDCKEDSAGARAYLEEAVGLAPNYLPAVDYLAHVLGTLSDHSARAAGLEQASNLVDSDEARSSYLLRAARSWMDAGELEKAADVLSRAVDHGPGSLLAREWLVEAHVGAKRWSDAAGVLRSAAAETEDAALRVSLLYRSARLSLARADDPEAAESAYRSLLDLVPDFLPATMDLRDTAAERGDWDGFGGLLEAEAEGARSDEETAWWNISAGQAYERAGKTDEAMTRYREALDAVQGHSVAHAAMRRVYRSTGDWSGLVEDLREQLADAQGSARRDALRLQLVAALEQLSEPASVTSEVSELLKSDEAVNLPLPALGILCEGLHAWDQAVACYASAGAIEDTEAGARAACLFQQGLLREEGFEDHDGAAELYTRADEVAGHHPMALENLETIYENKSDRRGLARVYSRQAEFAGSEPVQTFYALLAGDEQDRIGDSAGAIAAYKVAFKNGAGRERAYEALRRISLNARDSDTLREVTSELAGDGKSSETIARWMELADGLLSIDDKLAAGNAYSEVTARDPSYLSAWYHLERLHVDASAWNDVLTALDAIREGVNAAEVKKAVAARTESLLEDKGVTSESASDFYRKRLADEPTNVVALRGLGGIALSRGDTKGARGFYESLASSAKEAVHLAEAESQLGNLSLTGKKAEDKVAVGHFEKALEHVSAWRPAIDGLRGVYERTENWKALVGVIARESTAAPERRLELHGEIARLWQDKIGEPKIATASWNKVLQENPGHSEALERLLGLHEASGDWPKYLNIADQLLPTLDGEALRDRQAELGVVAHERAGETDRAITYLSAAIAPEAPSLPAMVTLRRIIRARGDWERVISLTERQAALIEDDAEKVELLVDAALIRLDQLLDREGAAKLFGRASEIDPENVPSVEFFVGWYYDAEAWEKSARVFERYEATVEAKDLEEDDDERMEATAFYFKFGTLLARLDDPDGVALSKFARALELTPTHLPSLEAAAPRYLVAEKWQKAKDTCRSILRLRGGMGDSEALTRLYLNLGRAETELGDTKNSLKRFKKVLDLSQNNVDALLGIAGVHGVTGEWNSLLSTYNSIIKYARDPEQVIQAYLTKGDVLERKLSISDKAVLHYEKVLMYDKNNVAAMTRLGQIALRKGDETRAGDFADRAVEAARDEEGTRLGMLLRQLVDAGESVNVKSVLAKVTKKAGNGPILEAFKHAAGADSLSLDKAVEAFAEASSTV